MVDLHHTMPAAAALTTSFYAAPQEPADAQRLFEAAVASAGWTESLPRPLNATRGTGSSLVLAREWGASDLEDRLVEAIEASYEPTWDMSLGEFTWGLGLDEPHPRGQYNAFLAAAEASGPGMWTALSAAPLPSCPQIVGVDFPRVAMQRAEWVNGCLHLEMRVRDPDPSTKTTFRLVGAEPRIWDIQAPDGTTIDSTASASVLRVPIVDCRIELSPGSY